MKKVVVTLCVALMCAVSLSAQPSQDPTTAPKPAPTDKNTMSIAGNWTISMDYGQGPKDIAAVMKLDGKKLTGMLSTEVGDTALEGEFAEGKANFAISIDAGGGAMQLTFTLTMKDADNITGTMGGAMGDIPFVGKRVKG